MKISDVAKLTGITVRALHHYDKIGLLKPSQITEAGYRLYSHEDLEKLQLSMTISHNSNSRRPELCREVA